MNSKIESVSKAKDHVCESIDKIFQETVVKLIDSNSSIPGKITTRRSKLIYDPPKSLQNYVWPQEPSFDNPLSNLLNHSGNNQWNFGLKDGTETKLNSNNNSCTSYKFDPDKVRSIAICYWQEEQGKLSGLELLDESDKSLVKCGYWSESRGKHVIKLEPGERIVGIAAHNIKHAQFRDFQFVISKKS